MSKIKVVKIVSTFTADFLFRADKEYKDRLIVAISNIIDNEMIVGDGILLEMFEMEEDDYEKIDKIKFMEGIDNGKEN